MKIICGLGNPGERYKRNRHNVGFMMVDYIINQCQNSNVKCQIHMSNVKSGKKIVAEIINIKFNSSNFIFVKPQLFMNQSGIAVKKFFSLNTEYRILDTLYVVHDDLDLKLGEYKIQFAKGPKLHNGIESIEKSLRTADFWRVRIGVDSRDPDNRISGEKYVLQDFTGEEMEIIEHVFREITKKMLHVTSYPASPRLRRASMFHEPTGRS